MIESSSVTLEIVAFVATPSRGSTCGISRKLREKEWLFVVSHCIGWTRWVGQSRKIQARS